MCPSALGMWLRWHRERREVQGDPRPRRNPDGRQVSMLQSSQTVHSIDIAYRYSRGVGTSQGVGGAGASQPLRLDLTSTSAISFSDCCLVPFSFQCDIRKRDLHWDVMRTCTWKASRQTGWPILKHITAYFIVHPTHAASLPDSLVHTNWLFTRQEKLAHTRALNLTSRKKEQIHNRSVVIHRRSYPDRKQLAQ